MEIKSSKRFTSVLATALQLASGDFEAGQDFLVHGPSGEGFGSNLQVENLDGFKFQVSTAIHAIQYQKYQYFMY